ncbi:MAG: formate/nitrite transporter family protein [Candidatus Elarobacter sp.]
MDYVRPPQLVETMLDTGTSKGDLPVGQIMVRGMLGGAFLAYGTSMAFFGVAQGMIPILAAALFPLGFIVINLLQVDLATGYFCYVPLAYTQGRMPFGKLVRCLCLVYVANLLGSVAYAVLLWAALTTTGRTPDATGIAGVLIKVGTSKTLHYEQFGLAGAFTAFVKGILCNWFVTLGVILPMMSRSVIGKALATFVPIYLFFGMGWEHLIVNMFIIPSAMLYGAPIGWGDWWIGNELPVTLGNFVGGFFFTGLAVGWIYRAKRVAA